MAAIYEYKTAEEVYGSLEPLIGELPDDIKITLDTELTSHGINGETLIFLNPSYLDEMNITNPQHQQVIMKAINTLYDTKVLANYIATFSTFKSAMLDQAIMDGAINLESLKNEGHEASFYKNILSVSNDAAIHEFLSTFEMIFNHPVSGIAIPDTDDSKQSKARNTGSRQSATTLPKLVCAPSANLNQMKQSIEQYTSILGKLRMCNDANEIQSIVQPLSGLDASKVKKEMYAIPATQLLHKCMFHETSIAQRDMTMINEDDYDQEDEMDVHKYNKSTSSILKYIATNKLTSSLGTSLLCNQGVTLKELQIYLTEQRKNGQATLNKNTNRPDSQSLLNVCHRIHKSYRSTSVETIAFLVIDVDSFYEINDLYGEQTGDELLRQIGEALFSTVHEIHSKNIAALDNASASSKCCEFYHVGNNRFYVLLSVASEEEALNYGSLIVNMMRNRAFNAQSNNIKRTVSVSVYIYNPRLSINLIKSNANMPLHYAKHHGKNQVIAYSKVKQLQNDKDKKEVKTHIWSKQLYDMIGVYGKYSYNLCKVMTKRFVQSKGVDLNWKNKKDGNNTIFMYCLENGCRELVEFFTKNYLSKLDLNITRDDGSNALLLSIKYDFARDIIEKIMERTNIENRNVTNKWNDNTAQLAQIKGCYFVVDALPT